MTDEELKNKCSERAKIFQQAMESCHSSSPIDCIEWFADRIADLEKENAELKDYRLTTLAKQQTDLSKYALNLEHKLSWYDDQLTKAKEIIKKYLAIGVGGKITQNYLDATKEAEQFLSEVGK